MFGLLHLAIFIVSCRRHCASCGGGVRVWAVGGRQGAKGREELVRYSCPDSNVRQPYGLLIFGVFSFFLAVAGTRTGEAWAHALVAWSTAPKSRSSFRRWSQCIISAALVLLDTSCIRSTDFQTELTISMAGHTPW